MRLALIADTFPPLRTSGAVQLRDLSREFVRQGHELTVLLPSHELDRPWQLDEVDGINVLRLKAPQTKDIGYVRRTLGEFLMPFAMRRNLRKSALAAVKWDGVVWYAPSIFHGPLARTLKSESGSRGYLIIRDIFPEWAVDMGLMRRGGPTYRFFDAVARYQYSVADVIGVQTSGNLAYFDHWKRAPGRRLEVLQNWLDKPADRRATIRIDETPLAGRRVFVYAGNMGVAQGMDVILELAASLKHREDIGFLFVGRGSDAKRLADQATQRELSNVVFRDEVHPDEIPDLYSQCDVGIVALDHRHKSHNIPGKFLTYMQSGLPVLANVNAGNDLARLVRNEKVGLACESNDVQALREMAQMLLRQIDADTGMSARCRELFAREFSAAQAVRQIVQGLSNK
ncbi:glycosyltransferase WbuB [Pandoraea pnomenusa]|jgi:glycosyltransferase involved in cell wall biosynthesis|uniref:Glycosyltransferase WbuB n=1 Tax=Pandoraea pnomenusa TaxID=93220 RepID=A0ABY6WNJ0_9BURK|nr:glycosyltransferase family 4 protein [Pandoraea pnomenusa]AHN76019.1 glycosyltransferase WbuB [Pandoraea pnomenusa]ANC44543.1 glycosyltransferase WbuB [Pandoraea pnomenusa]QDH61794.1 glycosyltransferase family 4 protein [Pandoraea pnomenusa]VVE71226.1 glycosyltransferase WbuB [Pandoraea pnomenusa]